MAYRKKTLRGMLPTTRRLARLAGEVESLSRRIRNLLPESQEMELLDRAEKRRLKEDQAKASKPTRSAELFEEGDTPVKGEP